MPGNKHPARHSAHPQSWSPWSDWKWDPTRGTFYMERFDWQGNADYHYDTGNQRTPRTDPLTAGFEQISISTQNFGDGQGAAYSDQTSPPAVDNSAPDIPVSPGYIHGGHFHDQQGYSHSYRDKGKGVAGPASHDSHYDEQYGFGSLPQPTHSYSQQGFPEHLDSVPGREDQGRTHSPSFSRNGSGDTSNLYHFPSNDPDNDDELQQALQRGHDELLGNSHDGSSPASGAYYNPGTIQPGTYDFAPGSLQEGETTPRGTSAVMHSDPSETTIIRGTPGTVEPIDNRFVVEFSTKFQPGEVFKILWSEPTGQNLGDAPISDIRAIKDPGGDFYVGYRRFIIVRTDESHHSTCVPILTYDRRACAKKGVRPSKHGIIFESGQKPRQLRNEPDLGFDPVSLDIYAEGEKLAKESRVNYSKLVTIEHNVKVFFIGRIPYPDFSRVEYAVNKCWEDKMHKSTKKSRR
ncbi:hypothetical protein F5Y14DRAFT_254582 [Nemania sp. NC0429]|nr:hypothetical protein F5Y14DRAFT_254582 [Nemania sp. NC0429]